MSSHVIYVGNGRGGSVAALVVLAKSGAMSRSRLAVCTRGPANASALALFSRRFLCSSRFCRAGAISGSPGKMVGGGMAGV